MKNFTRLKFFLLSVFLCVSLNVHVAFGESSYGVTVEKDIDYVMRGDAPIKGDLYRPADADGNPIKGPLPVFVLIHGGAWYMGSKDLQFIEVAKWLAQRGYAAFNVTYRLREPGHFPNSVLDVMCAVKYVRGTAKKYGLDAKRVAAMGGSAGGYLTAALAVLADNKEFKTDCGAYEKESAKLQASIPVYGPFDFPSIIEEYASSATAGKVFGGYAGVTDADTQDEIAKKLKRSSVLTYVHKMDTKWLIIQGTKDTLVPPSQANLLHDALKKAGVDSELALIDKGKHGFFDLSGMDPKAYVKALEVLEAWLAKKFPVK